MAASLPVLVAGGGIGGIAAALALVRRGFEVQVLEQSAQLGEIGAGIQLGPNAFSAFDALGIGDSARSRAVYTDEMASYSGLEQEYAHETIDHAVAYVRDDVLSVVISVVLAVLIVSPSVGRSGGGCRKLSAL